MPKSAVPISLAICYHLVVYSAYMVTVGVHLEPPFLVAYTRPLYGS
jgi:hypothetical protein